MAPLFDLFAPTRCLSCRRRAEPPWCDGCRASALAAADGCPRCGDPWAGHHCPAAGSPIAATVAVWAWEGPVRAVVATAKSRGAWAGWSELALPLARAVAQEGWAPQVVTGVPSPASIVRRRGIDHAQVLAARVAAELAWPFRRLLAAPRPHRDQGQSDLLERRRLPDDAFVATQSAPGHVVLVDDVLTTGATVRAAADVLGAAGAKVVRVAVLARAGDVSAS